MVYVCYSKTKSKTTQEMQSTLLPLPGATLLTFDLVGLPSIILPKLVEASVSAWILAAIPSGVFETAKQSKGSGPQLALSTCA